MFRFIKKQKSKVVIMMITIIMIMTATPAYLLAASTDTTAPEITANTRAGRIKAGVELAFTITDESPLSIIYYQWDRHIDSNSQMQKQSLTGDITKYVFKTTAPTEIGLHEFSIAAKDNQKNISFWIDIPYYVVNEDVPADYVDDIKPTFIVNTPTDYPYSGSTIPQGRTIKVEMVDENDIYWLGYKWVRELDLVDFAEGSTFVYKPGKEFTFVAPQETGKWYLQYYTKDGSNNVSSGRWSEYTVADLEAPVLTLNGQETIEVLENTTFNDPGASWTDNVD